MEKYYKKLMNSKKTFVARFADSLLLLLLTTIIVFGFTLVRLRNVWSALIITSNVDLIVLLLMSKMHSIQVNRFKKSLNKKIRDKLILEKIVFSKGRNINISGYKHIYSREYLNSSGEKALLIAVYPESVLTPKELVDYITEEYKEIIASCTFDDDCYLLCKRLNIKLRDKTFLLENASVNIDDEMINREIETEVMEINEIRKRRKRTSFAKEKWSKYLLTCFVLLAVSGFMGRFRIIYIAFAGMCMSFCFISFFISKTE